MAKTRDKRKKPRHIYKDGTCKYCYRGVMSYWLWNSEDPSMHHPNCIHYKGGEQR